MNGTVARFVDTVPWGDLCHAYGPAGDLPPLLEDVAAAKGRRLNEALGELCSRVLHQGTIYSASPPAVHFLIDTLRDGDEKKKEYLYGLIVAFADSARMAIEDGPAPPSCAGGDPADGAAIRQELADASGFFETDLKSASPEIRASVATLMTFIASLDGRAADVVSRAYAYEAELQVRYAMLSGLAALDRPFEFAPDFWATALTRESDPSARFVIRVVEIRALQSNVPATTLDDLVLNFVAAYESEQQFAPHDDRFFKTIRLAGQERARTALLNALERSHDEDLARILAERLLCDAFHDQRSGWGQTARSRLNEDGTAPPQTNMYRMALRSILMLLAYKLFPFLMRWRVKRLMRGKPKGIPKIDYWGLNGTAPDIPSVLEAPQREVLTALARKPELWTFRTNLWQLFGLPSDEAGLRRFLAEHA